jgi:hypothetical protein
MIIKETVHILNDKQYKVYSDNNFYIKNKKDNSIWTIVNTIVPDDFEETDIPIVIDKLLELLNKGLITQEEYDELKKE